MGKKRKGPAAKQWARPQAKARKANQQGELSTGVHKTLAPIHVDARSQRIEDPCIVLGFEAGSEPKRDEVIARARELLLSLAANEDSDRVREIIEARDRLTSPKAAFERLVGELHVPDPVAMIPGLEASPPEGEAAESRKTEEWTSQTRIAALNALYSLVEEVIEGGQFDGDGHVTDASSPGLF